MYDIWTNQWRNFSNLPMRIQGGGAVLCEGRLVTVGGRSEEGAVGQMWEYDEKRKVWKSLPPLKSPRYFFFLSLIYFCFYKINICFLLFVLDIFTEPSWSEATSSSWEVSTVLKKIKL